MSYFTLRVFPLFETSNFLALCYMCVCTHCIFIGMCVWQDIGCFLICSLPHYFETGSLPQEPFLLHFHLPSRQRSCVALILFLHVFITCVWGMHATFGHVEFLFEQSIFFYLFLIGLCRISLMGEFPVGSILLELHFLQSVCIFQFGNFIYLHLKLL